MKKIIFTITTLLLISCGDGWDNKKCHQSVQEHYPDCSIFPIPDQKYRFLVIDSLGKILYIETMGDDLSLTTKIRIK